MAEPNQYHVASTFKEHKYGQTHVDKQLKIVATKFESRFQQLIGEESGVPVKFINNTPAPAVVDKPASSGSGAELVMTAAVAKFDAQGKLIPQFEKVEPRQLERTMDWKKWHDDKELADRIDRAVRKRMAYCIWGNMWSHAPQVTNIELVRKVNARGELEKAWAVRATEEFQPNTLMMVPYIAGADKVLDKKPLNPDAIVVTVQSGAETETFWMTPDFSSRPEEEVAELLDELAFVKHSRSLFWACKRSPKEKEWNCELVDMKSSMTARTQWNSVSELGLSPSATATVVTVQVLVNTRTIPKGGEITVKTDPPKKKEEKAERKRTWEDDAKKQLLVEKQREKARLEKKAKTSAD